jgi:hypothetical protein
VSFGSSVLFLAFVASVTGRAAAAPPPSGAMEVIARVNRAAMHKDYMALRADMAQDFTWSLAAIPVRIKR